MSKPFWKVARGRTNDNCYFFWAIDPQDNHILKHCIIPVTDFWAPTPIQEQPC